MHLKHPFCWFFNTILIAAITGCCSNTNYLIDTGEVYDLSISKEVYDKINLNDYLNKVFKPHGFNVSLSKEIVYVIKSDLGELVIKNKLSDAIIASINEFYSGYDGNMKFSSPLSINSKDSLSGALSHFELNFSLKYKINNNLINFWFERTIYLTSAIAPTNWVWGDDNSGRNGSGATGIIHVTGQTRHDVGEFGFIEEDRMNNTIYIYGSERFSKILKKNIEETPDVIIF